MTRRAMILAAGFGTRLRPLTNAMAKPMVPVCNRPLIAWAIDSLLAAGINEIVINVHHAPESLQSWVPQHVGSRASVHFSAESEILGTGGGIRHARKLLEGDGAFVVVNGDTIQNPPIRELSLRRSDEDSLAALLLRVPPPDDRFTPVFFEEGVVTGIGDGTGEPLMFSGCHVISDRIFDLLPDRPFSGIVEDVYMPILGGSGDELLAGVVADDPMWYDVGTPRRFLDASLDLLALMTSLAVPVPEDSSLAGSCLAASEVSDASESSVIGFRCDIARDSRVRRSVVMDAARIGTGADICGSVIGPGVSIPPGILAENAFICVNDGGSDQGEPMLDSTVLVRAIDESRPVKVE